MDSSECLDRGARTRPSQSAAIACNAGCAASHRAARGPPVNRLPSGYLPEEASATMPKRMAALLVAALAACALQPAKPPPEIHLPAIGKFSDAVPGDVLPSGWRLWQLSGLKRPTEYRLIDQIGRASCRESVEVAGVDEPVKS